MQFATHIRHTGKQALQPAATDCRTGKHIPQLAGILFRQGNTPLQVAQELCFNKFRFNNARRVFNKSRRVFETHRAFTPLKTLNFTNFQLFISLTKKI